MRRLTALKASVMVMVVSAMATAQDVTHFAPPHAVRLNGLLGYRFRVNEQRRLLTMDEEALLIGFRRRPGTQAWVGEHVGKWLHAAVLTWQNTGNDALKAKIDRVVQGLIATQEPDGYLGTYDPPTRWTMERERGWDVWVHKYVLIGLLSYVGAVQGVGQEAGNDGLRQRALEAAKKAADLLLRTFGTGEGQMDLMERSTHVGMASGSVLQPMVWLYRWTGERRYLDFCHYIVWAWEHSPHGPKLLRSLLTHGDVHKTANAKAYEMMSCLVGALELYRVLRDEGQHDKAMPLLAAARQAWEDIVTNHLYLTGGTSFREHFLPDRELPNGGEVAETCTTVTLLQLTLELFRLSGDARYMDIAERLVFNHLLAAQHPDGDRWCYFTPLEGRKHYRGDINCCASSGPRGIALLPTFVYTLDTDGGIRVNLYAAGELRLPERGIQLTQETAYPYDGSVRLRIRLAAPAEFPLRLRIPSWCDTAEIAVNGEAPQQVRSGYHELRRRWQGGDTVRLELPMRLRVVGGECSNEGKIALMFGPLVLAVDERFLPADALPLSSVTIPTTEASQLTSRPTAIRDGEALWADETAFDTEGILLTEPPRKFVLRLTDFAHAGARGTSFAVWLPRPRGRR